MAENELRPIIVKRKKVSGGGGHHGGAWKVAYADFMTAMMAFFMLMWLLNATTETQLKGLADYFSPSIPVARISGGVEGAFGGESAFSEQVIAQEGSGASSLHATEGRQALGVQGTDYDEEEESGDLAEVETTLVAELAGDEALAHIQTRVTDEGLVIEIFSRPGAPVFDPDTGAPQPWLSDLALVMAELFGTVSNAVAVEAHISAEPLVRSSSSGWQVTTARAQAMRALLEAGGLASRRVARVTGHSDREPTAVPPVAPRNDRLEIILLRRGH